MKWTEFEESKAVKRPTPTLIGFDRLYPDRDDGYTFVSRRGERLHVGYTHPRTRRCVCHTPPVFEQYIYDYDEDGNRNVPAQQFVAICPNCEIRARGHGSLEWCRRQWNAGKFSRDTVMVRYSPKWQSDEGIERMCRKVIAGVIEEAVEAVQRKHSLMDRLMGTMIDDGTREVLYNQLKLVRSQIRELSGFIHNSPLMYTFEEDAVLSAIRKQIYPELTPEDRIKIPLNLTRM